MTDKASAAPQVDLNQADLADLTTLPGIGEKLAERIIRHREEIGPFNSPEDIMAISGISEELYRQLADKIIVSVPDATASAELFADEAESTDSDEEIEAALTERTDAEMTEETEEGKEGAEAAITTDEAITTISELEAATDSQTSQEEEPLIIWPGRTAGEADADGWEPMEPQEPEPMATESEAEQEEPVPDSPTADSGDFPRPWLLVLAGAFLGAFLAIGLMYIINGGALTIDKHAAVVELNNELSAMKQREVTINSEIDRLTEQLNQYTDLNEQLQQTIAEIQLLKQAGNSMSGQVTAVETRTSAVEEMASTLNEQTSTLEKRAATVEKQVTVLERDNLQLQTYIDELQEHAARFNEFLSGLRELLLSSPDMSDSSPTSTATADASEVTPSASTPTPAPKLTATPGLTLTPKPTPSPTASQ